jgi:hypothetical protein
MTELVMCRGPDRQAGAARPALVNAVILPSAQPPEPVPVACACHLAGLPAPHLPGCRPTWGEVMLLTRQR